MNVRRTIATVTVTAAAFSGITLLAPAAEASGGGGARVITTGSCSGSANWKLKAKHDDGRLEVEFEVESNRTGQYGAVRVTAPRTAAADRSPSGCGPPTGPAPTPSTHAPHTPGRPAQEPCASDPRPN